MIGIFASEKKRRIAAYDVMNTTQGISNSVIATLIFFAIGQLVLLSLYMKRKMDKDFHLTHMSRHQVKHNKK